MYYSFHIVHMYLRILYVVLYCQMRGLKYSISMRNVSPGLHNYDQYWGICNYSQGHQGMYAIHIDIFRIPQGRLAEVSLLGSFPGDQQSQRSYWNPFLREVSPIVRSTVLFDCQLQMHLEPWGDTSYRCLALQCLHSHPKLVRAIGAVAVYTCQSF